MNNHDFPMHVLTDSESFAIAAHQNPDGDAIGASLSTALLLRQIKKEARIYVLLEPFNSKFDIIPGAEFIYHGDITSLNVQTLICLDCGSADRLGRAQALLNTVRDTICIDHHISNTAYAKYNFVDPGASSTSELVYRLFASVTDVSAEAATAIYAGLVTDTGGFRHGCTSPLTLRIASELISKGIDFTNIYNEMAYRHSVTEAVMFGVAISNMRLTPDGFVAYTTISAEEFAKNNATNQDLDGVAEYLLNTRGVKISILCYEKEQGLVKVSMRSKVADVSKIAVSHGGGGHKNASGCTVEGTLEAVCAKLLFEASLAVKVSGVLNIYKEPGYTSHDVVALVRKITGIKKVGHTGTLDPEAEGVLPICIGNATKLSDSLTATGKAYRAQLIFGIETDTQDIFGQITRMSTTPDLNAPSVRQRIEDIVMGFLGPIEQVPPMYSAVKIGGKKLYELARKGKEIERPARLVTIKSINIIGFSTYTHDGNEHPMLEFDVECSKGTYIRTLCADIGTKIGCGACMGRLIRLRSGQFDIENSITLTQLRQARERGNWTELFTKMVVTVGKFECLHKGHQALIEKTLQISAAHKIPSVIIAFKSHPAAVLRDRSFKSFYTSDEKRFILGDTPAIFYEYPFNREVAKLSAEDFIKQLYDDFHMHTMVVGNGFAFGSMRSGTTETLWELANAYGFDVVVADDITSDSKKFLTRISSTTVRSALLQNDFNTVKDLTGRPFFVLGEVKSGNRIGRSIGFPTLNIIPDENKLLPQNGVFITETLLRDRLWPSVTNIGFAPTVDGKALRVETYIISEDFENIEAYGQQAVVYFHRFLRPETRFADLDALKAQLNEDLNTTKEYFDGQHSG